MHYDNVMNISVDRYSAYSWPVFYYLPPWRRIVITSGTQFVEFELPQNGCRSKVQNHILDMWMDDSTM